jgi:hypothetical protein
VSIIEGEVGARGLYAAMAPQMEGVARRIFALDHVEMASHTYSHPFFWADAELGRLREGRCMGLTIPGYRYDAQREIAGARDYINGLAPPGKKTRVVLWSGDTQPLETPVRLAYQAGLLNMNSGNTWISKAEPTLTLVGPIGMMKGEWFQTYAPMQNENVYTNNWTGPFYGFERVIETFEMTERPLRLKPVNIYYHTYIASKRASIASLHKVHGWAQEQFSQQLLHPHLHQRIHRAHAGLAPRHGGAHCQRRAGAARRALPARMARGRTPRCPRPAPARTSRAMCGMRRRPMCTLAGPGRAVWRGRRGGSFALLPGVCQRTPHRLGHAVPMACSSCALKVTCRCTRPSWRRAASCRARRARRQRAGVTGWTWRRQALDRPSSYSVAPGDASRSRILSWGALAGVVALAVGGLVLVFPKSDLMTLLRSDLDTKGRDRGNRDLSIAYLRNIIRTEPADMSLRLLLAEKLLSAATWLGARLVLDEAQPLARSSAQAQTDWDVWDLNWWQTKLREAQSRDRDSETVVAASELVKRLQQRVASVTTPAQVFAAMQSAQALQAALGSRAGAAAALAQARAIPGQLLQRLLTMPGAGMADLSRGASLALAEGQFQAAADLYFAARRKTAQRDARDTLLRQGVRALLAGGQPVAAWQAAVRETQPLPPGDELHWWLAELALAAAQPREAAAHLRNVVPVKDGAAALAKALPIERLQLAWDTFGAAADLNAALVVADAALLLQPQDVVWLERKAQASEWAGLAPQALAAWLALLKRNASDKALANVFRLSPMLYDDDALLAAWLALSSQRSLSLDEAAKVVEVYERLGSVDGALAFVRQLPAAQPEADAALRERWLGLEAGLLERAGRPAEALAVLERMRGTGLPRDDAMRLAQIYLRLGNMPLALRALQAARLPAGGEFDDAYWDLRADLAYETGERALALDALDRLIAQGKPQAYQVERAIRIRLDADRDDEALALAARLYPRYPQDNIVYAWLDGIAEQKNPVGLRTLLAALTPAHRARLEQSAQFLERRAGLYVRLGDVALARADYTRALSLQPDNAPLRVAYWWLLIDQQDVPTLRAELGAAAQPRAPTLAYAEVLAAGWQLLDEPRMALALMQPHGARTKRATFCGS